eukprot:14904682-Alexandrium_andersonii.AAC.1
MGAAAPDSTALIASCSSAWRLRTQRAMQSLRRGPPGSSAEPPVPALEVSEFGTLAVPDHP